MKSLTCFKAYDIRGKLDIEINEDVAYRIGRAFGEHLKPETIVVGGDVRLTSEKLKLALANGLQDAGVSVIDIGLSGTEEIYFATSHLGTDGGIEITASHNPIDYNGMKLVGKGSKPISADNGLRNIRKIAENNIFESDNSREKGTYSKVSILDAYVDKILSFVDLNNFTRKMKLVINSGNGAAGHVIDALEIIIKNMKIPVEIIKINNNPDGNFPHGIPNPLLPECRLDTKNAVIQHGADMGIAFDGDFDRCFFFDESGEFIEGYYIVGLLAESFLKKKSGEKIIHDPRLTWNTQDVVKRNGGIPIISKTGHAFIKESMREVDAIYGGEMSAHHYFRDFYYCDSGMIPWLLVTELLNIRNCKLSSLVDEMIDKYPASGEINFKLNNTNSALSAIQNNYESEALEIDHTDGLSLVFDKWRFNIRTSNTEPVVRLNVESKADKKLMHVKTQEILDILKAF